MSSNIIETKDLTKMYGDFTAVDSLNLQVKPGEVFGILGPNGAGKTTTILMLLGLTEPTSGKINVLGFDPMRQPLSIKSRAGYIPDQIGFYEELTARDNLAYIARLNGLSRKEADARIEQALEKVGLREVANHPVATFSRGMSQRLGVADVLLKNPQLIIMDEPTQGLDPELVREFLDLIKELSREGITILLSSHLLPQVQAVCDRVGLFRQGKMVLKGTVPELAQDILGAGYHVKVRAEGKSSQLVDDLRGLAGVVEVGFEAPDCYTLVATEDLRAEAAKAIVQEGGRLMSLEIENPSLDDIYNSYFKEVDHGPRS